MFYETVVRVTAVTVKLVKLASRMALTTSLPTEPEA
jgi:hypothetical protein